MILFLHDEDGAVTVDWVVITASLIGLTLVVMAAFAGQTRYQAGETMRAIDNHAIFMSRNFGRTPTQVAGQVTLTRHNDRWRDRRMAQLMDDLTDRQLQNQHRLWSDRAADPNDPRHDRSADQLALLEIAMEARGVLPHEDASTAGS